jgi:hypothetical protein
VKICAESPSNSEYTLCGNAFDAPDDPLLDDMEPFKFAAPGQTVTCTECKRVIDNVRASYPRGYRRAS